MQIQSEIIEHNLYQLYDDLANIGIAKPGSINNIQYITHHSSAWPDMAYMTGNVLERNDILGLAQIIKEKNISRTLLLNEKHCNPANDEILSEYRFIKASQWVNMYAQVDAIPVERSTVDINEVDPKVHEDMIDWTSIVSTVLFAKRNLDTNIFRSGIENSFLKAFLLKVDGRPVATAMLYCGVKEVGVYMVATLPEFQKKGMGQQIMHTVIQAAKKLNYKTVVLQSTPGGVSLYEKMGFEKAGSAILYYSLIKI